VEGKIIDTKPTVLFLCTPKAAAPRWHSATSPTTPDRDNAIAWSGGSEPAHEINPAAIAAMAEVGIGITGEYLKPWTDEIVRAANVVITMGCGDACPISRETLRELGTLGPGRPRSRRRPAHPRRHSRNATTGCWPSSTSPNPMTEKTQGNTTI
jgi:hypothetical protein